MPEKLYAGIDVGATNVKYGLVDQSGEICFRTQITTPRSYFPEKLLAVIVRCGERLLIEADDRNATVTYVGIGSPGTVNIKTGIVQGTCPNLPGWEGVPLREEVSNRCRRKDASIK